MTDAVRRVLSLAGADPRTPRPRRVRRDGRRARDHAGRRARHDHVLVPDAAPGFSAFGLLTANHVVDDSRGSHRPLGGGRHRAHLRAGRRPGAQRARRARRGGRCPQDRMRFEWLLNWCIRARRSMPRCRGDHRGRTSGADVRRRRRRVPPPQRGGPAHRGACPGTDRAWHPSGRNRARAPTDVRDSARRRAGHGDRHPARALGRPVARRGPGVRRRRATRAARRSAVRRW